MSGIYIHIPYCHNKCLYCDFYSGGARIADWPAYVAALLNELKSRAEEVPAPLTTLYIGGGTPSLMPPQHFVTLIEGVKALTHNEIWKEFTLEANPEDISEEMCRVWKGLGVNRVSIGIQSLKDEELKAIGRRHNAAKAIESLEILKRHFDNITVDVMFGIPGQTPASYAETLKHIISLRPSHISSYSLMLEEGTAMTYLVESGRLTLPEENEWMKMFDITSRLLAEAGYLHYEISNYSLPGFESMHNSSYWYGKPYLGLGPGAHSYDGSRLRRANPTDLKAYIDHFSHNEDDNECENNFYQEERLSDNELREEMIMTRLRLTRGLSEEEYELRWGEEAFDLLLKKASRFLNDGNLRFINGYLSLTEKGMEISDRIISSLF